MTETGALSGARVRRRPLRVGMIAILAGTGLLAVPVRAGEASAEASGGGEAKSGEAPKLDPSLVPMDEITVPIVDGARMEGVLRFTLVLRARDADEAAELGRKITQLRSAALLAGLDFARLRASPYRAVDVQRLADNLDTALKAADPTVEQALIVRVGASAR